MVGAGVLSLPYAMSELGWYVQQHIFLKGEKTSSQMWPISL